MRFCKFKWRTIRTRELFVLNRLLPNKFHFNGIIFTSAVAEFKRATQAPPFHNPWSLSRYTWHEAHPPFGNRTAGKSLLSPSLPNQVDLWKLPCALRFVLWCVCSIKAFNNFSPPWRASTCVWLTKSSSRVSGTAICPDRGFYTLRYLQLFGMQHINQRGNRTVVHIPVSHRISIMKQ